MTRSRFISVHLGSSRFISVDFGTFRYENKNVHIYTNTRTRACPCPCPCPCRHPDVTKVTSGCLRGAREGKREPRGGGRGAKREPRGGWGGRGKTHGPTEGSRERAGPRTTPRGLPPQVGIASNEGPRFCEDVDITLLKRTGNALIIGIDAGRTLRLNGLPVGKLNKTLESSPEPS